MRFRNTLMLTAMVSISVFFALSRLAAEASQNQFSQRQGQTQASAQGQHQGRSPAPPQSQSRSQVNNRVRELQEQYQDLLKHEYNPSNFHPSPTAHPSFNKPGWLNHSRPRAVKRVSRSHGRHRYYRRKSSQRWIRGGRKSALHRYSKRRQRAHVVLRRRPVRRTRAATRRPYKRLRTSQKRAVYRKSYSTRHSAARKLRSSRASSRRQRARLVRPSAKAAGKRRRSVRAAHVRKSPVKKSVGRKEARRTRGKSYRR